MKWLVVTEVILKQFVDTVEDNDDVSWRIIELS